MFPETKWLEVDPFLLKWSLVRGRNRGRRFCEGGILDGYRASQRVHTDGVFNNPFAVGQMVNHPPKGGLFATCHFLGYIPEAIVFFFGFVYANYILEKEITIFN